MENYNIINGRLIIAVVKARIKYNKDEFLLNNLKFGRQRSLIYSNLN